MELVPQAKYQQQLLECRHSAPRRVLLQNCRLPLDDGNADLVNLLIEGSIISSISTALPEQEDHRAHDMDGAFVIPGGTVGFVSCSVFAIDCARSQLGSCLQGCEYML